MYVCTWNKINWDPTNTNLYVYTIFDWLNLKEEEEDEEEEPEEGEDDDDDDEWWVLYYYYYYSKTILTDGALKKQTARDYLVHLRMSG